MAQLLPVTALVGIAAHVQMVTGGRRRMGVDVAARRRTARALLMHGYVTIDLRQGMRATITVSSDVPAMRSQSEATMRDN
jgi:hypothetical protein